jgi:hypothetical protein
MCIFMSGNYPTAEIGKVMYNVIAHGVVAVQPLFGAVNFFLLPYKPGIINKLKVGFRGAGFNQKNLYSVDVFSV